MTGPGEPAGAPQEPETPNAAAPEEESGPPRCRECDAVLDDHQTYCLECGAPTPLAPSLRRRGGMGALAAGLAVLGVGAGFLGYAVASDDGGSGRPATVLTAPPPVTTPSTIDTTGIGTGPLPPDTSATTPTSPDVGTGTGFVTTTSGSTAPGTPLPGTSTGTTDTGGGLPADTTGSLPGTTTDATTSATEPPDTGEPSSDWPVGTSAWTAVVASAEDPDAARQQRSRARAAGFGGAGILISDDHPNLSPGLYVVYIGVFSDRGRAVSMADRARATFRGAYARYVES